MRIPVKKASKDLQMSEKTIRRGIRQGELPIGVAIANEKGEYSYAIYQEKIDQFLDKKDDALTVINKLIDYLKELRKDYA